MAKKQLPLQDLAASAYRAYGAALGNKSLRGEPLPPFEKLPKRVKKAWEAAVKDTAELVLAQPGE